MSIIKNCGSVPFDLELKITGHYKIETEGAFAGKCFQSCSDDYWNKIYEFVDRTKTRVSELYPQIKIFEGVTGGYIEKGPKLSALTDQQTFRRIFGDIRRGISLIVPPTPLAIPLLPFVGNFRIQWYRTEDFHIPENISDLVKDVHLSQPAHGSFREFDLLVPFNAK